MGKRLGRTGSVLLRSNPGKLDDGDDQMRFPPVISGDEHRKPQLLRVRKNETAGDGSGRIRQ